jgi:hypothetical protein
MPSLALRSLLSLACAIGLSACGGGGGNAPGGTSNAAGAGGSSDGGVAVSLAAAQQGNRLTLERSSPAGTVRLALDLTRGGFVSEASVAGRNFVNADDTGRGVQFAIYDGDASYDACAGCSGTWGWNAVQGGDRANHGAAVQSATATNGVLHTVSQASQWSGTDAGDQTVIEQTVSPVENEPFAFRIDFRISYTGTQDRANALQELPAAYAAAACRHLVSYSGSQPFTGEATSSHALAGLDTPPQPHGASERWFALVDDAGQGLTVYAPGSTATVRGFATADTAFARLDTPLSFISGRAVSGHYYLIVGDQAAARQTIYRLHAADAALDLTAPTAALDAPAANGTLSGTAAISGWAVDAGTVAGVEVRIDGQRVADAALGFARPDVQAAVPGAPADAGFALNVDTRAWANGPHVLEWRTTDLAGNTNLQRRPVQVAN